MDARTRIKFENASVSGINRTYQEFTLKIPGHALDDAAVIVNVPDRHIENIRNTLEKDYPAITMTILLEESETAEVVTEVTGTLAGEGQVVGASETETGTTSSDLTETETAPTETTETTEVSGEEESLEGSPEPLVAEVSSEEVAAEVVTEEVPETTPETPAASKVTPIGKQKRGGKRR